MPNLHPILAGWPAAMFILLLIFELLQLKRPQWISSQAVLLVLITTLISVALSFFSGYQALDFINRDCAVPEDLIAQHHALGRLLLFAISALTILGFFRWGYLKRGAWLLAGYYSLLVLCLGLVFFTGSLGGRLVFEHGLAVKTSCPE